MSLLRYPFRSLYSSNRAVHFIIIITFLSSVSFEHFDSTPLLDISIKIYSNILNLQNHLLVHSMFYRAEVFNSYEVQLIISPTCDVFSVICHGQNQYIFS